jgi:hypothetical protein
VLAKYPTTIKLNFYFSEIWVYKGFPDKIFNDSFKLIVYEDLTPKG